MTGNAVDQQRDVLPRWRSVRRTVEAGEFQRREAARPLPATQEAHLREFEERWDIDQDAISAAEYVGALLVAGELDAAREPSELLIASGIEPLAQLGRRATDPSPSAGMPSSPVRANDQSRLQFAYHLLAQDKKRVTSDSRNAMAWADLARRYTALGQFAQADRALIIARALAPGSRYLNRISARFMTHVGDVERAYALLSKFERTRTDPWLMASLLSVAASGNLPIKSIRLARGLMDSGDFRPIETSELVSELATLEIRGGNDKRARQLFRRSLMEPTDNSLAQFEWAAANFGSLNNEVDLGSVPYAAEAIALEATEEGDWEVALSQTELWIEDQPFDTRAAGHASYLAGSVMERWPESIEYAKEGLVARPGHALLSNNLAYAYLEYGDTESARDALATTDIGTASVADKICLVATYGLLEYRSGDATAGAEAYRRAVEEARRRRYREVEAMATANFLREQVLANVRQPDFGKMFENLGRLEREIRNKATLACIGHASALFTSGDL